MIDKEAMMRPTPGLEMAWVYLVMLLFALPMLCFGAWNAWTKLAAKDWTPVTATVLSSKVYERTGKSHDWCVMVRYAYQAGGRTYESRSVGASRIGSAGCQPDKAQLERDWGSMRPGRLISARYDPAAPQRAAIVVERPDFFDGFLIIAGIAMFGACAVSIRDIKRR